MDDKRSPDSGSVLPTEDILRLIRGIAAPHFGATVLAFVSAAGPIRNFGTFHTRTAKVRDPLTLTLWAGPIGSYWFKRNASHIAATPEVAKFVLQYIEKCDLDGERLDRYRPTVGDPLYEMYRRSRLIERCSVTTRTKAGDFHTFFLRSEDDGPISDAEWLCFQSRLRIAQELVILRHRLAGSEAFRHMAGTSLSSLRERGAEPFVFLSARESDVCDAVIDGLSVTGTALRLGVSEATVRTLRQRAYRKLRINSAVELATIIVKDAESATEAIRHDAQPAF